MHATPPTWPDGDDGADAVAADDRRWQDRSPCRPGVRVRVVGRPDFRPVWATVYDVSATGVGLLLPWPYPADAVLALGIPGRVGDRAAHLSARVRHVAELPDGGVLLGCSLSRSLTGDELFTLLGEDPPG